MKVIKYFLISTGLKKVKCEKHSYYKGFGVDESICDKCTPQTVKKDYRSENCGRYAEQLNQSDSNNINNRNP